jgi:cytochrome c556
MNKKLVILSAVALSASLALGAFAHSGATGIVKERMDGMMAMGKAMKSLVLIVKGAKDYDAAVIENAAKTIQNHSGENLVKLFPKDAKKQSASVAKDEIWENWAEFQALSQHLQMLSVGLEATAGNGIGGVEAANTTEASTLTAEMLTEMSVDQIFPMIAGSCSSCHSKFRAEK